MMMDAISDLLEQCVQMKEMLGRCWGLRGEWTQEQSEILERFQDAINNVARFR